MRQPKGAAIDAQAGVGQNVLATSEMRHLTAIAISTSCSTPRPRRSKATVSFLPWRCLACQSCMDHPRIVRLAAYQRPDDQAQPISRVVPSNGGLINAPLLSCEKSRQTATERSRLGTTHPPHSEAPRERPQTALAVSSQSPDATKAYIPNRKAFPNLLTPPCRNLHHYTEFMTVYESKHSVDTGGSRWHSY